MFMLNRRNYLCLALVLATTTVGLAACDDTPTAPSRTVGIHQATESVVLGTILSVSIAPEIDALRVGDTVDLFLVVQLSAGVPPSGPMARWSSDTPSVLSVVPNGQARALATGSATVHVEFRERVATRRIEVVP